MLSNKLPYNLMLTQWSQQLNPVLGAPLAKASLLSDITLTSGANVINHKLGAKLQGYIVVLNSASATFFDNQSTNPSPQTTLILNASAPTVVSLLVF
jgi:hypothetical protein